MRVRMLRGLVAAAMAGAGMLASGGTAAAGVETPDAVFNTVGSHDFEVPADVCAITAQAFGAEGGDAFVSDAFGVPGGQGGSATATIAVAPGEILHVNVGGQGQGGFGGSESDTGMGGFNGGGDGGLADFVGAGGGGASDVRQGGSALTNRVVIGGGGGGASPLGGDWVGGSGGGTTGGPGAGDVPGQGGTQVGPGAGGGDGTAGDAAGGAGGDGGTGDNSQSGGGGGGGGLFGGGGGGGQLVRPDTFHDNSAGGGGGSGFTPDGTGMTNGVREGNGVVQFFFVPDSCAPPPQQCQLIRISIKLFGPPIVVCI